jgi:hypothetical protein
MILTIAIIVYAVGVLGSARLLAGHLAWKWKSQFADRPEALDWLGGICFGLLAGLVWPALLVARVAGRIELPAIGAEQQARERDARRMRQARQDRIAELEAEVAAPDDPA